MKTFVRLIRRYVLAAVGIVLLLVFLGLGLLVFLGWQETTHLPQRTYASSEIADAMVETPAGLALGAAHTPEEWMDGYAWAMVLDDTGHIRWSYALPDALNHAYTTGEVAGFARWYLDDYPVFCWAEDYGLFVIGLARGSLWKYSIYTSPEYILNLAKTIPLGFGLLLLLAAICCFLLSWQGAKRLETVASGLDALAEGQTVQLPTEGFAGELAEKLNQTSAQLQTRNELLARRDDARTQWIAGVSHDVRTPLALILGWAEQLERDAGNCPAKGRRHPHPERKTPHPDRGPEPDQQAGIWNTAPAQAGICGGAAAPGAGGAVLRKSAGGDLRGVAAADRCHRAGETLRGPRPAGTIAGKPAGQQHPA